VLAASTPVRVPDGALVLEQGGAPAAALFVVRSGAVALELEGDAVDVLGPGESFGFPSLVTGDHPVFDVRAVGDTSVLRIDREVAERWLGSAPGLRYLAAGIRRRAAAVDQTGQGGLASEIAAATDVEELIARAGATARAIAALFDRGVGPRALAREVARAVDAATVRALDLHIRTQGHPPARWAWLVFGSVARRESALIPDQDHTIVWEGSAVDDAYFAELAAAVTATLAASGWPRCAAGVLATSPGWRGPIDRWVGSLLAPTGEGSRGAFRLAIALDVRKVAGTLVVEEAVQRLREGARSPEVRWRVARLASDVRPPIGAFGGLETHRLAGRRVVDVKLGGLLPVTDLARAVALGGREPSISTSDRLRAAAAIGAVSSDTALALEEAFETFRELRVERQVGCLRADEEMDDLIEPSRLDAVSRIRLREAFRVVDAAQADLRAAVGGGRFRLPSSN
jgi:CBS domain-containing protein